MDTITVRLPTDRKDDLRIVQFWGQRRLHEFADTGVFTISTETHEPVREPRASALGKEDALASLSVEFERPLEIERGDRGNDPYNRDNYSRRTISP